MGNGAPRCENAPKSMGKTILGCTKAILSNRRIAEIGAGGMGEVYLAHDTRLNRKVALKVFPAALVHDDDRLRRFDREAQAASRLNHPNIITIYEIGEKNG